jgi:hypothetical protein
MDFKKLVDKLKAKGLDLGEEAVAIIVGESFDWFAEEGVKSGNGIVKTIAAISPVAKPIVLAEVDKIDGEDDEGR